MTIPKTLNNLASVFSNPDFMDDSNYAFSYRNRSGDLLHVFKGIIVLKISNHEIHLQTPDLLDVRLGAPTKSTEDFNYIELMTDSRKIVFFVDTGGAYGHDVYPIFKMVRRRMLLDRRK